MALVFSDYGSKHFDITYVPVKILKMKAKLAKRELRNTLKRKFISIFSLLPSLRYFEFKFKLNTFTFHHYSFRDWVSPASKSRHDLS